MITSAQLDFLRKTRKPAMSANCWELIEKPNPAPPEYPSYVGGQACLWQQTRGSSQDNRVLLPNAGAPVAAYNDNSLWSHFCRGM